MNPFRPYRNPIMLLGMLLLFWMDAGATHYRAGEITYRLLVGRTYEVTAITYTDPGSAADPSTASIFIDWGDGTVVSVGRKTRIEYPNNKAIVQNVYIDTHTYQTDGTFKIGMMDRNRVDGIKNINNGQSRDIPFYVESKVLVNSSVGNNQSPILINPPIDKGCVDFLYMHNPGAYDSDGDSLYFRLIPPQMGPGENVPNYEDPQSSDSFAINHRSGMVYWAKPMVEGYYNIAIEVMEFRIVPGRPPMQVGSLVRDMQILIEKCKNTPPVIDTLTDRCVDVGESFSQVIRATDPDPGQLIRIEGYGGPFEFSDGKAFINPDPGIGLNIATTMFNWTPFCPAIRYESYHLLFKAQDDFSSAPLAGYRDMFVKVIAPAPRDVNATQVGNNGFNISFRKDSCGLVTRYEIYRRIDSSHWNPDKCQRGIPAYTGFLKLGSINAVANPNDTVYKDNENGKGLSPLITYCYRVVAVYPPRNASGKPIGGRESESYASKEVCNTIIRSKPIITKVSVNFTDSLMGAIQLAWLKPDTLDTTAYKPPYKLIFKHGTATNALTQFGGRTYDKFSDIPDSGFVDTPINTATRQQFYQIELYATVAGDFIFADASPIASSVRAIVYSTDNANILSWNASVPWFNDTMVIYRKNNLGQFVEIGRTLTNNYKDTGLINGVNYCYKLESRGQYPLLPLRLYNFSQEICGTPVDTIAPCPPALVVIPPCSDYTHYENVLNWTPDPTCGDDVVKYNVYYKVHPDDPLEKIGTINNQVFTYSDGRDFLRRSIAGCYVVTGVDSFDNESPFTNMVCIDNCPEYNLPNVFTPNGDGPNDLWQPFPYRFIDHIVLRVYNRWGDQVFGTEQLDVNWDGKDERNGDPVVDGVYYYVCEVYEHYLEGTRKRVIKGTVQVIR